MVTSISGYVLPNRYRFPAYIFGRLGSLAGDIIFTTTLPYLIFSLNGTKYDLGLLSAIFTVFFLMGLLTNLILLNKFSKKHLMIFADAIRFLPLLISGVLYLNNTLNITFMVLVSIFLGLGSGIFQPLSNSFIPKLVSKNFLNRANAVYFSLIALTGIISPLIATYFIQKNSFILVIFLDLLSFLVSISFTYISIKEEKSITSNTLKDLISTINNYIRVKPWVWMCLMFFSISNVFYSGLIRVIFPVYSSKVLFEPQIYGSIISSMALGGVVSGAILTIFKINFSGKLAYCGALIGGIGFTLVFTTSTVIPILLFCFLGGIGFAIFEIIWQSQIQLKTPKQMLVQFNILDTISSNLLTPFGLILAPIFMDRIGITNSIILFGVLTCIPGFFGMITKNARDFN